MIARIGCVILAEGAGRRWQDAEPKLLLRMGNRPLAQHAIDAACGSQALACTLVLGDRSQRVLAGLDPRRCAVVRNPQWEEGIAASVRAGLERHRCDDACIFVVADQPFVSAADIDLIIHRHAAEPAAIVALAVGDVWGAPMLFPRRDFDGLLQLRGDAGAKRYALKREARVRFVPARSDRAFDDVDTRADLWRLAHKDPRT